ncbi:carboxyl-terminal processing protease [Thermonema lapsum]|uniref:Carboxyl-terminal processing protease n=1 Tax=Thermonema lapsum TaxID=28195 RepID=A0A846MNR5_9BACT|nr:carboxy terminal-processing peptidase [Thermonema lapsum]NIK73228.1 carboxyl-terminal processing protease [Thermonema lapsum]
MKRVLIALIPLSLVFLAFKYQQKQTSSPTLPAQVWEKFQDTLPVIRPGEMHQKRARVVSEMVSRYHYRQIPLNDSMSSAIFDMYLKELDENKLYFLASDIEDFEQYRYALDDHLLAGDVSVGFYIFNVYLRRNAERIQRNMHIIRQGFDFSKDEVYDRNRSQAKWAQSMTELDEAWRKVLKDQFLTSKLAGEADSAIQNRLIKRYERLQKSIMQTNAEDIFSSYLNALAHTYDPHTAYLSPIDADNFRSSMRRSLEGIGAVLSTENDYVIIREVRPGGPAYKSGKLHPNDKIIAVAQGDEGEFVDVVGWRLDEVVQMIRGPRGTVVRLLVLPAKDGANAKPMEVRMVREKITFEEQSAQKKVIVYTDNKGKKHKVGVIQVPAFYINIEEYQQGKPDYKSTTNDVRRLIGELQAEGIEGLVIDLRYNGGGSLKEAIDLTSLFIPRGPVVQVKDVDGKVRVNQTEEVTQVYDGKLVVLVNRLSASASEIFSGAIQDYRRGLVIGETTFGKGTVQSVIDLARYIGEQNQGQLNITLAKFYRISGESTQLKGVTPDIQLPSFYPEDEVGEASYPTALPWDKIAPASYKTLNFLSEKTIKQLQKQYDKLVQEKEYMQKLLSDIQKTRERYKRTTVSLNESKRKAEMETEREQKDDDEIESNNTQENSQEKPKVVDFSQEKDAYLKLATEMLLSW